MINYKKISKVSFPKLIWKINNDPESRKFSKNSESFSYTHHLRWFKKILKKNTESIYVAKKNNKIIGIIRSQKVNNKNVLSWALRKECRGKNLGKNLLRDFVILNNKIFYAQIHKLNFKSISICKSSGFKAYKKSGKFIYFKIN